MHPTLQQFEQSVKKALDHLHAEFSKLQTGRANASLVEHIAVEAYGQRMELKAVASISVQDARSMAIQPWDKSVLADIEKAIQIANIGVNPVNDGIVVRLNFPPMTEERRKQITKVVSQLMEQAKIAVRQDRQKANDEIKAITDENEKERLTKELQKLVDDGNKKIEESAKKKEAEVMTV
jgi:ribosome recycling factor